MASVYLETSFFSACVSERTDAASIYRRLRSWEWWDTQRALHDLVISAEVLTELSHPEFRGSAAALAMTAELQLLPLTDDVPGLARILVVAKVMPGPEAAGDALHVAAASVHRVEYMLSWNVRHLANLSKVEHLRVVCRRAGYVPPTIVTPDNLWSD